MQSHSHLSLGPQNVIDACVAAGVQRLVYTSSASVVFDGRGLFLCDEGQPYADLRRVDYYTYTKIEGGHPGM
jgi:sterol-4alpha-carboxylate 3-dehydrogenase (decarboxylating)